jgi:AsmA protein
LQLRDLDLTLDDTKITGTASARLATPRELRAELHGDRLDLGRYRGPDTEQTSASPPAALLAPLAAPMAFLQGGTGSLALNWDLLTLDQLRLETLRLRVRFAGDDLHIEDFSTRTLGGTAALHGSVEGIDGRDPEVNFAPRLKGIALAEVRRALASNLALDGVLDLTLTGSARGADSQDLEQSLRAQGDFRITDPTLSGTNIERTFCDLVATVERTPKRRDWPEFSRFETIVGDFRLAGPNLTLNKLTTGIGNLALRASGTLDRAAETYELTAVTRLEGDRTSADGCPVRSGRLRDRDIPLRCTGSFGAQTRTQCAPDPQFVAGLVEDRVLEELRDRGKLEGERGKAVEGLLKGLLNRDGDGD